MDKNFFSLKNKKNSKNLNDSTIRNSSAILSDVISPEDMNLLLGYNKDSKIKKENKINKSNDINLKKIVWYSNNCEFFKRIKSFFPKAEKLDTMSSLEQYDLVFLDISFVLRDRTVSFAKKQNCPIFVYSNRKEKITDIEKENLENIFFLENFFLENESSLKVKIEKTINYFYEKKENSNKAQFNTYNCETAEIWKELDSFKPSKIDSRFTNYKYEEITEKISKINQSLFSKFFPSLFKEEFYDIECVLTKIDRKLALSSRHSNLKMMELEKTSLYNSLSPQLLRVLENDFQGTSLKIDAEVFPKGSIERDNSILKKVYNVSSKDIFSENIEFNKIEKTELKKQNGIKYPKDIKTLLDEYIVGQENAKKTVSQAVFNHIQIVKNNIILPEQHLMLIGPSGCGKTEIFRALKNFLDFKLHIIDCSSLGFAGYKDSGATHLKDYLSNINDGDIVVFDEFDKILLKNKVDRDDGKMIQSEFLKIIESEEKYKKCLFVFCGAFTSLYKKLEKSVSNDFGFITNLLENNKNISMDISVDDIIDVGVMTEILGRISFIIKLEKLKIEDYLNLLKDKKSLYYLYRSKFLEKYNTSVSIEDDLLSFLAEKTINNKLGARGLNSLIVSIFNDILYMKSDEINFNKVSVNADKFLFYLDDVLVLEEVFDKDYFIVK